MTLTHTTLLCAVALLSMALCLTFAPSASALGCPSHVPTNDTVNLEAYMGTWYQLATNKGFSHAFEKGIICDVAEYTLESGGMVKVNNTGIYKPGTPNAGQAKSAIGKAKQVSGGKLEVAFFSNFYGPYWITQLYGSESEGYSVAVIWSCSLDGVVRDLWVLSRKPTLPDGITFDSLYATATAQGIPVADIDMQPTDQSCWAGQHL